MDLKEAREKRAAALAKAKQLLNAEGKFKQQEFDAAMAEADDCKNRIDAMEQLAEKEARAESTANAVVSNADRRNVSVDQSESELDEWMQALGGWAAAQHPHNVRPLTSEHRETLFENASPGAAVVDTTADGKGGTAVEADGVAGDLYYEIMKYRAPILSLCTVRRRERGSKAHAPGVNDTGNYGRFLSEGTERSAKGPSWVKAEFEMSVLDSDWLTVSYQALEDMHVRDLGGDLMHLGAERVARMLVYASTNAIAGTAIVIDGDNKGTPKFSGMVAGAGIGVTTAANNAVTADEFIDFVASLDPAYEPGTERLMASKSFITRLSKIRDGEQRRLFDHERVFGGTARHAMFDDAPARGLIDNVPYVLNNELPTLAAGKTVALYGDLRQYLILLTKQLSMSSFHDSQTADRLQVWYAGHLRMAGVLRDSNAIKKLVIKA